MLETADITEACKAACLLTFGCAIGIAIAQAIVLRKLKQHLEQLREFLDAPLADPKPSGVDALFKPPEFHPFRRKVK